MLKLLVATKQSRHDPENCYQPLPSRLRNPSSRLDNREKLVIMPRFLSVGDEVGCSINR